MWLTGLKVVLVVFLLVGAAILVITFIRKSRANGFPTPQSSSQFWQIKGATPPTPKPDWADESGGEGDAGRQSRWITP